MTFIIETCGFEATTIDAESLEEGYRLAPAYVHAIYLVGTNKRTVAYGLSNGDFVHPECRRNYMNKFPRENPPMTTRYLVSGAEVGILSKNETCAFCKHHFLNP